MITINYQAFGNKGFQLRLRLYQNGETRFINVTKMLKGDIQKKHWNQKKQRFIPSCPFSEENNNILVQFRQKYDETAIKWTGTLYGMMTAMAMQEENSNDEKSLHNFIHRVVDKLKSNLHSDGTIKGGFEEYIKTEKRIMEFCEFKNIEFSNLLITEITPVFVNELFRWIEKHRSGLGMTYVSGCLHALLARAERLDYLNLNDFKKCNWCKKSKVSSQKYNTLSDEQIRRFAQLNLDEIANTSKNTLYRDFCFFLLYTGQSPCDAICLRYSDIKQIDGVSHFVFIRRKIADKQSIPCAVPINSEVEKIMQKYQKQSKDGYIFPIRNKSRVAKQVTINGDIKHFVGRLNVWLKEVGRVLGCKFPLHTYTFRHTAITRYVEKGIPVTYIANMMGTSVDNIEKIYYNNRGDKTSRNKVLLATEF